jgi:hypothetical protein
MASKQDRRQPAELAVRKPYVKPGMEKVRLVLDEAVLGFCKTATATGPNAGNITCDFGTAPCSTAGS